VTVVVGYVPKPEGRAALRRAVEEAAVRGESLLVLNTTRGDSWVDTRLAAGDDLEAVRAELASTGLQHEVRQLVGGHEAADEVLAAAEEVDASLIVIGLRRRSPVGKLLMGSTSQRILLDASCPVLAVKAD